MNLENFYNEIIRKLPVVREKEDFRDDVRACLSEYIENVKSLDNNLFTGDAEKQDIVAKIQEQSDQISEIINSYYAGQHAIAFEKFQQLFNAPNGIITNIQLYTIQQQSIEEYYDEEEEVLRSEEVPNIWFRARIFDNKQEHTFKEMFHIPLNKREIVNTQRYSAPGYPCLYLGNTIYSCWEEMHRPRFDDIMFSGFKVKQKFKVYDLRIPKRSCFEGDSFEQVLQCMPLIIACMIQVKNYNYPFKPEYIIPQLLIDAIICNNRKDWKEKHGPCDMPWGVIYTSTHISKDFPYGTEYLENIALPAIKIDGDKDYCEVLASFFDISDPLCYEYEALKENDSRIFFETITTDPKEKLRRQYLESKMGYLENRIKKNGNFQMLDYIFINGPQYGIVIPQDGSPVQVELRASGPWEIVSD